MNRLLKIMLAAAGLCALMTSAYGAPEQAQANPPAAGNTILSGDAVQDAGPDALKVEADTFESVRQGLTLTLALCGQDKNCKPDINREEVKRILDTLDQRINVLGARYSESGDKSLEPALLEYADERDKYTRLMAKLDKILPPAEETKGPEAYDSLFKDTGESLQNDQDAPPPD